MAPMSVAHEVSQPETSSEEKEQPLNMKSIRVTLAVSHPETSSVASEEQPLNM